MRNILVIKLGALGDIVLAFGPFAAIRAAWPAAHVTLLTTAPFAELAGRSPWFDSIICDSRPGLRNPKGLLALRRAFAGQDLVIDLQTSGRSSRYRLLAGDARWSGIGRGSTLPHDNPWRDEMHTIARQQDQLRRAGITPITMPNVTWLQTPPEGFRRPDGPYVVLAPGAAPHRPAKRWPAERFGVLAAELRVAGLLPVIVGTKAERDAAEAICAACPDAIDLTGRTSVPALASLFGGARLAIGNDTGPMHLAAMMGCPCIVLFSAESRPRLTAPVGRAAGQVRILRQDDLADLDVTRVRALARTLVPLDPEPGRATDAAAMSTRRPAER